MLTLVRKPPQGPPSSSHLDPRVKVLASSFAADPIAARNLAYHAAQIIALSRWHPVYSPVEGMRLFLAGVVLWGFGKYYRPTTPEELRNSVVRLDMLPWVHGEEAGRGEEWIRQGVGRAAIGVLDKTTGELVEVVEVCGDRGAAMVLKVVVEILGALRFWGLGGEFKGLLEELVSR